MKCPNCEEVNYKRAAGTEDYECQACEYKWKDEPKDPLMERIWNDFNYHSPTQMDIAKMKVIREKCLDLAILMRLSVPVGRELSIALTNLEQASMWANAGIARQNPLEFNKDKQKV